jgi:hypothetical protein
MSEARKVNQFWYSAKHAAHSAPHRCYVTIDGVEHVYTEWSTGDEPITKHLEDLELIAEADEGQFKIRVENAPVPEWPITRWRY